MIGTTLGHYEITGPLGRGGMGEAYRARDARLGREVAVKALPREFASDPERMARFEREAKVLARLNHPNIATLYGLETGEDEGMTTFLVMELVEGEDLSERLERGAIPPEEALPLASPRRVRALIARCLRRDPKMRQRDMGDVRLTLLEALEDGDEPDVAGGAARARSRWLVAFLGAVAGLVLGAGSTRPSSRRGSSILPPSAPCGARSSSPRPSAGLAACSGSPSRPTGAWSRSGRGTTGAVSSSSGTSTPSPRPSFPIRRAASPRCSRRTARGWPSLTATSCARCPWEAGPPSSSARRSDHRRDLVGRRLDLLPPRRDPAGARRGRGGRAGEPRTGGGPRAARYSGRPRHPRQPHGEQPRLRAQGSRGDLGHHAVGIRQAGHRWRYAPRYVPSGHLVFMRETSLFAAAFDLERLEVTGPAVQVVDGVAPRRDLGPGTLRSRRRRGPGLRAQRRRREDGAQLG